MKAVWDVRAGGMWDFEILQCLRARDSAIMDGDFLAAGFIEDELQLHGVHVDDDLCCWWTTSGLTGWCPPAQWRSWDGSVQVAPSAGVPLPPPPAHLCAPGQPLAQVKMGTPAWQVRGHDWEAALATITGGPVPDYVIHNALVQREEARLARDFGAADRIRNRLRQHCIFIDDGTRSWEGPGGRTGKRPDASSARMTAG